jgi:hypothetical protein
MPLDNVAAELVITDIKDPDSITYLPMKGVATDARGVYEYSVNFESSDNHSKRLRIRFLPTMQHLQNKFEFDMSTWL